MIGDRSLVRAMAREFFTCSYERARVDGRACENAVHSLTLVATPGEHVTTFRCRLRPCSRSSRRKVHADKGGLFSYGRLKYSERARVSSLAFENEKDGFAPAIREHAARFVFHGRLERPPGAGVSLSSASSLVSSRRAVKKPVLRGTTR